MFRHLKFPTESFNGCHLSKLLLIKSKAPVFIAPPLVRQDLRVGKELQNKNEGWGYRYVQKGYIVSNKTIKERLSQTNKTNVTVFEM